MKYTDFTLLEQMRLTELEIKRRRALLDLNEQDIGNLSQCQGFIHTAVDSIVDEFYKRLTAIDENAVLIGDADTLRHLRHVQRKYILDLFSGFYDLEYVNNRLRIGMVHKRSGVEPKLFLSAMMALKNLLEDEIQRYIPNEAARARILRSLDKLLYFDATLVFDTYIRSLVTEIEIEKEKTENYARSLEEKILQRTKELEALSSTDALTGVYNKRVLLESLRRDLKHAERVGTPLSVVYFDIDHFKELNDQQGHHRGDDVLRDIGQCLRSISREADVPCRYGGDEFCVVLPDATRDQAREYCERLVKHLMAQEPDVSLSIGIVQAGPEMYVSPEDLIVQADRMMYQAKERPGTQIAA